MSGWLRAFCPLFREELREVQLREERERCRLLQDSLHALATEHHVLERSLSRRQSFVSMEDEFFDCDDDDDVYDVDHHRGSTPQSPSPNSPDGETFSDALSQELAVSNNEAKNHAHSQKGSSASYGRTRLPVPMLSRADFSFWSILKQCVGKELSKITMPVVFNEPLSFLQRLAEYMEYAPLIERAATCDDPLERMLHVTAFAISALSSNWERIGKPFNPLLGETYELDRPDLGFRYVGEQVSHHPPISAFHAQGSTYSFYGSIQPKLKFWGKTVEITPKGTMTLELHNYNETYTWQNINCCIHNVIVGTLWVEHYGVMEINCNKSEIKSVINFKQAGWFAKELHHVEGFVYKGKSKEFAIYGSWVQSLYACKAATFEQCTTSVEFKTKQSAKEKVENSKNVLMSYNYEIPGQRTLWKVTPRPPHSKDYYHFSLFSMCLNELLPNMEGFLPPTDARFRPDIRSMEEGNIDGSAQEKNRVEEKQRDKRKERKKKSQEWTPQWFKSRPHSVTTKDEWIFNTTYWDRRWKKCPDIF